MLRGTDVKLAMNRVETVLTRAARTPDGPGGVIHIGRDGGSELGIDKLRSQADVTIDLPSGSARPVVGAAIRAAKRVMRRGMRWYMAPIVEQQNRLNNAMLDLVESLRLHTEQLLTAESQRRWRDQVAADARVDGLRADLAAGVLGAALATGAVADQAAGGAGAALAPSTRRSLQYRAFEDRHRGSGADIAKLLAAYVPLFEHCERVVDVGCGRGEFLAVMRDAGISAYGVDSDESMVEAARAQDLEVDLSDGVAHLRGIPAGSVDGVFSSQVAEHLGTAELMALLEAAYQRLAPGGVLVVETPNPESLFIFAAFFYVDLTHIKPIHPEAMRWAMEVNGFEDVSIRRIMPVPDGTRLQDIPADLAGQPGWAEVGTNIGRLNDLLYGPQHYAAIATKVGSAPEAGSAE